MSNNLMIYPILKITVHEIQLGGGKWQYKAEHVCNNIKESLIIFLEKLFLLVNGKKKLIKDMIILHRKFIKDFIT